MLHTQSKPTIAAVSHLATWPPAYPSPLLLLFSPFFFLLPHHGHFLCSLLLPVIISLPTFLTLRLFFPSLYSLCPLDVTCFFHLSFLLSSLLPYLFQSQSIHTPKEKQGPDEHREAGTNRSIDLPTHPLLCPSDRQQKTKCLLSETLPISFLPHPDTSLLHCLPHC